MFDHRQHAKNQQLDHLAEGVFDPMADILPAGEQGVAKIDHFTISPLDALDSIAAFEEEFLPTGRYARLKVNGELMMSDSPMEKRTNLEVVKQARGRVLIAGMGIGMILHSILRKPEVRHVTVIERYQDVVDLVLPSLAGSHLVSGYDAPNGDRHIQVPGLKLEVIVKDIFEWVPPSDLPRYHVIYFDIWAHSQVRFLPEMRALHSRYRPVLAKGGWMSSWTYDKLLRKEASDAQFQRQLPLQLERGWKSYGAKRFEAAVRRMLDADPDKLSSEDKEIIRQFALAKGIEL